MEEEKGVRYDAKKLTLEVFRKWKALIVITLVAAVIFCVVSITGSTSAKYEAKEGFSISYPQLSYDPGADSSSAGAEEVLNYMLAEQQRAVARAVDTLTNTAYINVYNSLEGADNEYTMSALKENIKLELTNSNTTLTVTVSADSAKDAVLMLSSLETQINEAIGSGETEGYTVRLTYKNSEEDLKAMYDMEAGGAVTILMSAALGIVIGFVIAVVILLIWSAVFMRVTYAEDITMQTEYPVLATVYDGENNLGEAVINSAIVRGKNDSVTYVMGVMRSAGDIASAWAAREMQSGSAVYVNFDEENEKGIAEVLEGEELEDVIKDGVLCAGRGLDLYGKREQIAELFAKLKEKYARVIVSGYSAADARSELLASFADDTALVVDEGYSVKKLIASEEKYKGQGRNIEGGILRKKNARKK